VIKGPGTEEHGLGWIDAGRGANLVEFTKETTDLDEDVATDDVFSTEFLK